MPLLEPLPLLEIVDLWVSWLLAPVAIWILISGIDDLFIDAICLVTWASERALHREADRQQEQAAALQTYPKRIAIFVPLWRESSVIREMVGNNVQKIEYISYDFFLGAYPNDDETLEAVKEMESRYSNVHVALCGNDGPTSKADCLNWIHQRMLSFEEERKVRFEVVVTHDAEDVIHPHSLCWINYYSDTYDMIQVPVLPLATPLKMWTHGVYCDEFAEFQTKDMTGRQVLGGFIPSNGVGTGFTRWALDRLAGESGRVFEPECLTEDYENGLRLHYLKCPQLFMPLRMVTGEPMATREFFPQSVAAAIKQRTRWVTGIALQSWERHGWRGGFGTAYWMWRDRKGLVGNPLSMLTSAMFVYGLLTWIWSHWTGSPWGVGKLTQQTVPTLWLVGSTTTLQLLHLGVRAWCTSRVYGWRFAAGVPVRAMIANYINFRATLGAIGRYSISRLRKTPLVWLKTDHHYPVASHPARRRLGEILIADGRLTHAQLEWALESKPRDLRLGEHLVRCRLLTEEQVYHALSVQASVPFLRLDPKRVRRSVARALPAHVVQAWRVLPFQVAGGYLFLAAAELPESGLVQEVRKFTTLQIRVQLVTMANFEALRKALL